MGNSKETPGQARGDGGSQDRFQALLQHALGEAITRELQESLVVEVLVNPDGKVWVEYLSRGKKSLTVILSTVQRENIIKLLASHHHMIVDANNPELACEIPNIGIRFQGWLPPVVSEACFTLRKPASQIFSLDNYVSANQMTAEQSQQLKTAIQNKQNIIVAGGTGSGKTTFTNALLAELTETQERILVIEDVPELQVAAVDHVKLCTSPNKSMHDLVKGALRMRPDRIVIGEVRDGAALAMLKAWNMGHPGGICTVHANSAQDTLLRLHHLVQEVLPAAPISVVEQAVDLIVFIQRNPATGFKVAEVLQLRRQNH
ncbi:MAG: P-type conjugative transfer ATPase TrbB [marine bacterium B5-7]|nr:MAG: P-type conjugative transfer ATPase TrbB [marine bacterium B5-7]